MTGPAHFGNFEANARFLEQTGVLRRDAEILEIGSGTGSLLQRLIADGYRARGVEINPELVAESRRWHGELPLQLVEGVTLPFADRSFDVVLSFDVFEHIPDSDAHVEEVRRVLKAGGWYLLQTPSKWSNTLFETIRWRSFTRWRADHCSLHSYGQLDRRFKRHGFETAFADVPVVTAFYRQKVRRHLGPLGALLLRIANPDRLPVRWRTNLYLKARKRGV